MGELDKSLKFKKPYFCPLCMTLFLEKGNYKDEGNDFFTCMSCKEEFHTRNYENEIKRKGQNYRVTDDLTFDTKEDIRKIILNLWKEGYSNREIQYLTKFSRTRIQKETALKEMNRILVSKKDFCIRYLKIKRENYDDVVNESSFLTDILIDAIRKANLFGCSQRQISKLFNVSHREIKKAKTQQYEIIRTSKYESLVGVELDKELDRVNKVITNYEDSQDRDTIDKEGIIFKKNKIRFTEEKIELVLVDKVELSSY